MSADPTGAAESQPFIVMEYVDGLLITTYCERRGLGVTARLELVRKVCDALSYAHRQLGWSASLSGERLG